MSPPQGHPQAAPRHDWSARARSTAMEALRYTRFVSVMKRALPLAAFAVIAAVVAFFFIQRQPARKTTMGYERLGHIQNDLAMIKPRLTGQDAQGHPFVITADAAIQDASNPKRATLQNIQADLNQGTGWLNASADHGVVDMKAGQLELGGGIEIFSDQGYEMRAPSASVDLDRGVVHGHAGVTGQGPLGSMRADRFHFDRDSRQLVLDGNVMMRLTGKKT